MMTEDQIKELVLRLIRQIAPEADLDNIEPNVRFRDQFDFDSVDCLNLVLAIQQELKTEIPELDYPKLGTLNGCAQYLAAKSED
jgi:acyl carrier protein